MKNLSRAQRKKIARSFKVGDVITWGCERLSHVVVEVTSRGVIVDSTSSDYGIIQPDGSRRMLVLFDGNMRSNEGCIRCIGRGPIRKVSS